jgi:hypothetical protein
MIAGALAVILAVVAIVWAIGSDEPWSTVVARGVGLPSGVFVIALGQLLKGIPDSRE